MIQKYPKILKNRKKCLSW